MHPGAGWSRALAKIFSSLLLTRSREITWQALPCIGEQGGSRIVHTSRPIQANYARSLIAAATANTAARVSNIHPDNVGRSFTTVSVPEAAAPVAASLEG